MARIMNALQRINGLKYKTPLNELYLVRRLILKANMQ